MRPLTVSFGAGVNSTALLVGLRERGIRPDLILFADTFGELPKTYEHLAAMSHWCAAMGMPEITTVAYDTGPHASLEAECLTNKTLPSIVFGNRGCSVKWKRQPQARFFKSWSPAVAAWAKGEPIDQMIGIDAGETHRGKFPPDAKFNFLFPLIEWDWGREECFEAIERAGIKVPGKSACWFCPAMKKREVLDLGEKHPGLFDRAVAMERTAAENNRTVRGLGRHWSWENLVNADRAQGRLFPDHLFPESPEVPCMCFDGEDES